MSVNPRILLAGLGIMAISLLIWGCSESTQPQDGCPGPYVPTSPPSAAANQSKGAAAALDAYTIIQTFAGTGEPGNGGDGLSPTATALYWPQDIAFGPLGHTFILDWNNHRVRVLLSGRLQTLIGTGYLGDAPDGCSRDIGLNHPTHVSFDPDGNLILAAWHNSKVMLVDLHTNMATNICGTGARAFNGDGGPAIEADLDLPVACMMDDEGRLLIMDQANQCLRRVANGIIDTFAGTPRTAGFSGDGGPAIEARFNFPTGQAAPPSGRMAMGADGTIYIADTGNNRIRILKPQSGLPKALSFAHDDYVVNTIAGNGAEWTEENRGFSGDNVPALEAQLDRPCDVDVDSQGNVYFADTFNHCIRKVDVNGIITTFAGTPNQSGFGGDDGDPRIALLDRPYGLAIDADDNVFIADTYNNRIRVVWKDPDAHR